MRNLAMPRLHLGWLLAFQCCFSCANVIGLERANNEDTAGAGGSDEFGGSAPRGGSSTRGGNTAQGGSSSVGGTSNPGGTEGRGGSKSTSGGSGGASSDTHPGGATACGDVVAPDPDLVHACVMGNSCDPLVPTNSISTCITYAAAPVCGMYADSCSTVSTCLKRQWEPAELCTANDFGWKCDQDRAVNCSDQQRPWSVDCMALGGTCSLYSSAEFGATTWPCLLDANTSCTEPSGSFYCDGDMQYGCEDGHRYGLNCNSYGMSCFDSVGGTANCVEPIYSCDLASSSTCTESNTVEWCDYDSHAHYYDCSPGGGTCTTDGLSGWYCPAPGCTPADEDNCVESCEPDSTLMNVCVGGARYQIDCTFYGFDECVLYSHPSGGKDYVACRMAQAPALMPN